jgi:hypothetical protein
MVLSLAIASIVSATPDSTLRLAMPGLSLVRIDGEVGAFYAEHLALQLKFAGADVVTAKEISALLGMERQRQLLGCADSSSSCIAEIASALGADGVVLGDIAQVGDALQVNLKIVSASDARTLAAFSASPATEKELLERLTEAAYAMARQTGQALGREVVPRRSSGSRLTRWWWAPLLAGAAVAGTGAGFFIDAKLKSSRLTSATAQAPLDYDAAAVVAQRGREHQTLGAVLLGTGGALAAFAVVMLVVHLTGDAAVAFIPSSTGAAVAVTAQWP